MTDTIIGTAADDVIAVLGGDNLVFASAGADQVTTGSGADEIYGADGDDVVKAGDGENFVDGGAGNDRIEAGAGEDSLHGGTGDDVIEAGAGDDSLIGGSGNDVLFGGDGDDSLSGGEGADELHGGDGDDRFDGRDGDDRIEAGSGDDLVTAGTGDDVVYGGDGSDSLVGNEGNDTLSGGADRDFLRGYEGDDVVDGGEGDDSLSGDEGDDRIVGGNGQDTVFAGNGDDVASGDAGDDQIYAEAGDDTLDGGEGADQIFGGEGADSLAGGAGDDELFGDGGVDVVDGGDGADVIDSGNGADVVAGGAGRDAFVVRFERENASGFMTGDGPVVADTIADFEAGDGGDVLDLAPLLGAGLSLPVGYLEFDRYGWYRGSNSEADFGRVYGGDLFTPGGARLRQDGADTVLEFDTGFTAKPEGWQTVVRLLNVDVSTMTDANFLQASDVDASDGRRGSEAADALTAAATGETLRGEGGDDVLTGSGGADVLVGGTGNDVLAGGAGVDTLRGDAGADVLAGGAGKDLLMGGAGDDLYRYGRGDGVDMIVDVEGANDTLAFGAGITTRDVQALKGNTTDGIVLMVSDRFDGTDRVLLEAGGGIDRITFDDGTVWTAAELRARFEASYGSSRVEGTSGADTLRGGDGDTVYGGTGGDTYRYERGDGAVEIFDEGPSTDVDTLSFGPGIDPDALTVRQGGGDLVLGAGAFGDVVTLRGREGDVWGGVERFVFDDGTTWDRGRIVDASLVQTDAVDQAAGDGRANVFAGSTGNDSLSGGGGDDLFHYRLGDGNDSISGGEGADTLTLGAGIAASDVGAARDYRNTFLLIDGPDGVARVTLDGVETIRFADGTFLTAADVARLANRPTPAADRFYGGDGGDVVSLLDGDDVAFGDDGDDRLSGDGGNDWLYGEAGADVLDGGAGDDALSGGAGDDAIDGGAGDDVLAIRGSQRHFAVERIRDTVTVRDLRDEEGTDTARGVETLSFQDADLLVRSINDGPVLAADAFVTAEQTEVRLNVRDLLANDRDRNQDDLTVTEIVAVAGGTVTFFDRATGDFGFRPADGDPASRTPAFNGEAVIAYAVDDGYGGVARSTATITVTPVNDAPILAEVRTLATGTEDQTATGVLPPAWDEDDTVLAYRLVPGSVVGGAVTLDADTGAWTFVPAKDFSGPASFRYVVGDGEASSGEGEVRVDFASVNDAPVATADAGYSATAGTSIVIAASALLVNDRDVDGDALAISAVSAGTGGSATLLADGSVQFTAAPGHTGPARFSYTVSDGRGGEASAQVTVEVKPAAPTMRTIEGTERADRLVGTDAAELVRARGGNDVVQATHGHDGGEAGAGADGGDAGGGHDQVRGGDGCDALAGGAGNDVLLGEAGVDALVGGDGDDRLSGGSGVDHQTGGAGADAFVFEGRFGLDTVVDFQAGAAGRDVVDLATFGYAGFTAVMADARQTTVAGVACTVIDVGADADIVLAGVRLSQLTSGDFLYG